MCQLFIDHNKNISKHIVHATDNEQLNMNNEPTEERERKLHMIDFVDFYQEFLVCTAKPESIYTI